MMENEVMDSDSDEAKVNSDEAKVNSDEAKVNSDDAREGKDEDDNDELNDAVAEQIKDAILCHTCAISPSIQVTMQQLRELLTALPVKKGKSANTSLIEVAKKNGISTTALKSGIKAHYVATCLKFAFGPEGISDVDEKTRQVCENAVDTEPKYLLKGLQQEDLVGCSKALKILEKFKREAVDAAIESSTFGPKDYIRLFAVLYDGREKELKVLSGNHSVSENKSRRFLDGNMKTSNDAWESIATKFNSDAKFNVPVTIPTGYDDLKTELEKYCDDVDNQAADDDDDGTTSFAKCIGKTCKSMTSAGLKSTFNTLKTVYTTCYDNWGASGNNGQIPIENFFNVGNLPKVVLILWHQFQDNYRDDIGSFVKLLPADATISDGPRSDGPTRKKAKKSKDDNSKLVAELQASSRNMPDTLSSISATLLQDDEAKKTEKLKQTTQLTKQIQNIQKILSVLPSGSAQKPALESKLERLITLLIESDE